ncbi:MAG: hypothetical protein GY757_02960 [bacterium]|nr:hypothetical protein [bacterium]
MSLKENRAGNIWIGSEKGLTPYRNGQFTIITACMEPLRIVSIYEEEGGGIWFGTRNGGLYRYQSGIYFQSIPATFLLHCKQTLFVCNSLPHPL